MLRNAEAERWQLDRVRELYRLVTEILAADDSVTPGANDVIARHRAEALAAVSDKAQHDRIAAAPRSYLLRQSTSAIVRQAEVLTRPFGENENRVRVTPLKAREWSIDVATRDRPGLLANITGVLAANSLSVTEAVVATWPDGVALESFRVKGRKAPDPVALEYEILGAFDAPLRSDPLPDAVVAFDQHASPWHTSCEVAAKDRPGLLHTIATAFTAAGVEVIAATITADKTTVYDRFELVGRTGHKLTSEQEADVRRFLAGGVSTSRRWFRDRYVTVAG
jgi:[protein-PII] uridylyltransferase